MSEKLQRETQRMGPSFRLNFLLLILLGSIPAQAEESRCRGQEWLPKDTKVSIRPGVTLPLSRSSPVVERDGKVCRLLGEPTDAFGGYYTDSKTFWTVTASNSCSQTASLGNKSYTGKLRGPPATLTLDCSEGSSRVVPKAPSPAEITAAQNFLNQSSVLNFEFPQPPSAEN